MEEKNIHNPGYSIIKSRFNVYFPRPVSIDEAEKIFGILAKKLPAKITYELTRTTEFSPNGDSKNLEGKIVHGRILLNENQKESYTFTCINTSPSYFPREDILPPKLDTLWVATLHPKEKEIRLWDNSRKIIEQYFKDN